MDKKAFSEAEIEVINFDEDVIATSGGNVIEETQDKITIGDIIDIPMDLFASKIEQ